MPQSVRVTLSDAGNHELYHWTFKPNVQTLAPGQSVKFVTRLASRRQRRVISKCVLPKTDHERTREVLFTADQVQERVRLMARTIARAPLVPDIAMPVLVGGFVFAADLLRALSWRASPWMWK